MHIRDIPLAIRIAIVEFSLLLIGSIGIIMLVLMVMSVAFR